MATARQGLTLEEFLALPEEEPALEYFDGVVTQKVAPKPEHSALQLELALYLDRLLRPRKLARVFPELRTTYSAASPVPDIAVYRWERVPRSSAGRLARDALTPPDLAVEILSPGQSLPALAKKCLWYVEHGVPVALLLDPRQASIRVFRPHTPASLHRGKERIALDEIAPGLAVVPEDVFSALDAD
jgi:Uma2 family endonuclease